jgi:iron(III) transport system permease protein
MPKPGLLDQPRSVTADGGLARRLVFVLTIAVCLWLAFVPVVYLIRGAFFPDNNFSLAAFQRTTEAFRFGELVWNSAVFSIGSMIVSVTVGVAIALALERTDIPFRGAILFGALSPLFIPAILYTISWVFLASPGTGLINVFFQNMLGASPLNVFTMTGMIFVQGMDNAPLVVLLMMVAFRTSDPALEEAALMSGATKREVVRKVTLPVAAPAILAAALITLIRNLESFETPAILGIGGGTWVFTTRIWRVLHHFPSDYGQAGVLSVVLLLIAVAVVYLHHRMGAQGAKYQSISGKGFRPRKLPLGKWRLPVLAALLAYVFVSVVLPLFIMVYASTQAFYAPPTLERIGNASLTQYQALFADPQTVRAFRNSLLLGVGAATLLMTLTASAGYLVVRTKIRGRWLLDLLTLSPLALPGIVIGVAVLFIYLRFPLPVYGTLWILLSAYLTKFLPYAMRYSVAGLMKVGTELEESATMSGATWTETFRKVIFPLLAPGLIAGWLYVFMMSMRELSASLLVYSPGTEVIAVQIWELWENAAFTRLSALGVVLIGIILVVGIAAQRLGSRFGVTYDG